MIEFLAGGALFGVIGFGLGRLRFHALMRNTLTIRHELKRERVQDFGSSALQNVWTSVYEQTLETARELQKSYITAGTVGLAASATILAKTGAKPIAMYASASLFLIAIVSAFGPLSFAAIRLSKSLSRLSRKIQRDPLNLKPALLPQPLRKHRHSGALTVALLAFGLAVVVFSIAVSGMMLCESKIQPPGSFWMQCV
jgi:hypothetical protein